MVLINWKYIAHMIFKIFWHCHKTMYFFYELYSGCIQVITFTRIGKQKMQVEAYVKSQSLCFHQLTLVNYYLTVIPFMCVKYLIKVTTMVQWSYNLPSDISLFTFWLGIATWVAVHVLRCKEFAQSCLRHCLPPCLSWRH